VSELEGRLELLAARWQLQPRSVERLRRLLALLARDPTAPSSVTDPSRALDVHVADSLSGLVVTRLRDLSRLADVGSGAGFPGVVLAIAMPDAHFDLIEASSRKCSFLERITNQLGLDNTSVVCRRAEEWAGAEGAQAYDGVVVRAVGLNATLVEYAAPLLELGGLLVAWKGRRDADEEAELERAAETLAMRSREIHAAGEAAGFEHRHLHVVVKSGPTPSGLPRRAGIAKKRPFGRI
jgi:16S rRNA (guanine527-N7)-methyltransferase